MSRLASRNSNDPAWDPELESLVERAVALYGVRVTDNVDLSRASSSRAKARVAAKALMENGDLRAFVMARQLLAAAAD